MSIVYHIYAEKSRRIFVIKEEHAKLVPMWRRTFDTYMWQTIALGNDVFGNIQRIDKDLENIEKQLETAQNPNRHKEKGCNPICLRLHHIF